MEFELGHTYSGYKILDIVRRSRSTVQYRVQNTLAQRVESLLTLTAAAVEDPDAAERFLREVRIRARLSHPHIVAFYTAVPIEGRMAMTTELPDSLSLADRLLPGALPWAEALDITRQLLDALQCLHLQSFVHCDITPENILFAEGGFCKLADFSQARAMEPAHVAESGAVVGNPRYISPEQVKGERTLDQRSDLYSLGVILYEMLCGRPPFQSRSQFELMMAHVHQAPAAPSGMNPKVPWNLDALVLKALSKAREDRYQSVADFTAAVANAAREAAAVAVPEVVPVTNSEPEMAVVEPESVAIAEPQVAPEPVTVTEPELLAVVEPEPISVAEPEVVPEVVAVVEPEVLAAPEREPVAMAEAEVMTEPVAVAEPEVAAVAEPETVAVVGPILKVEARPVAEPAAFAVGETEPGAIAGSEVAAGAVLAIVAVSETEPISIVEPEMEAATEPEPAAIAKPEAVAVAPPEPVMLAEPGTVAIAKPRPVESQPDRRGSDTTAKPSTNDTSAYLAAPPSPVPELQTNLWAAAAMISAAASASVVPPSPIGPERLPLAALPETPENRPKPAVAPEPERDVAPIPAFMTTLRNVPGPKQWAVFGGTAAFLGVIWAVIWFAVGK